MVEIAGQINTLCSSGVIPIAEMASLHFFLPQIASVQRRELLCLPFNVASFFFQYSPGAWKVSEIVLGTVDTGRIRNSLFDFLDSRHTANLLRQQICP